VQQDVIMEFATPLLSLYEMSTGGFAHLSPAAMKIERKKFREILIGILGDFKLPSLQNVCKDKFIIVDFQGEQNDCPYIYRSPYLCPGLLGDLVNF